jgi:signal transduction histidine kinase
MSAPEDKARNGRTPFFSRLRVRLLVLVLLAILPALGLVLYTGFEQRAAARADAEASARRVVKLAAASQKQHFESTRQLLATLAQLPQVRPDRAADCQALFTNLVHLHPIYANIGGLDAEGKVFASAKPPPTPQFDLSDQAYFKKARDTRKFAVGEYQTNGISGRPTLAMAYPLFVDTNFAGVVFAALDLKWLNQLAARADLPEGATLTLIALNLLDRKGTVLVRYQVPDPGKSWIGLTITNEPFLKFLAEGSERTGPFRGLDRVKRLYASTPLSRTGGLPDATVSVGIPEQAAYAAVHRTMRLNLIFLGIVAGLALAAAWTGGDFFVLRQVRGLVEAARRLSQGDLAARSGVAPGPGELGQLAHSFDNMAASIQRHVDDLQRAQGDLKTLNEELEERVLDRTAELRRSNEDLEQFAYVASHDLQEPLHMITSYIALLRQREGSKLDQNSQQFIAFALDGATRMQQFIQDLLAYSRVGKRGGDFEPVDLHEACAAALANLQAAIEKAGAEVTLDTLPTVKGDMTLLSQLFQNLVGNALKFRGEAPPQIHVGCQRKGAVWELVVSDNGIGIAPQDFERVFVVFQRLHAQEKFPGTGIGLSVCKKIVERHGGRIWVESKPGKGARFYFTIPAME